MAQAEDKIAGNTSGLTDHQSSGVVGPSGTSGEHYLGRDQNTTAGTTSGTTSGLPSQGSHLAQAENKLAGNTAGFNGNQSSGAAGHSGAQGEHHLGREAAVGAGGVGLAQQ